MFAVYDNVGVIREITDNFDLVLKLMEEHDDWTYWEGAAYKPYHRSSPPVQGR